VVRRSAAEVAAAQASDASLLVNNAGVPARLCPGLAHPPQGLLVPERLWSVDSSCDDEQHGRH
jgi:hypothetical protein